MHDQELERVLTAVSRGELSVVDALEQIKPRWPESSADVGANSSTDQVSVIETHIDDMNPELLGFLMERLLDEGALDVAFSPLQMKKNRPAVRLTVIASPPLLAHLSRIILLESTAIGIRHYPAERLKLERAVESRQTTLGEVRTKVLREAGVVVRVSPEFEECRRLARETGRPLAEIYRIVERETGVV